MLVYIYIINLPPHNSVILRKTEKCIGHALRGENNFHNGPQKKIARKSEILLHNVLKMNKHTECDANGMTIQKYM